MRKKKVAFTGVFDLANYGDHLFPEVFDREIKKREIECEMFKIMILFPKEAKLAIQNYIGSLRKMSG